MVLRVVKAARHLYRQPQQSLVSINIKKIPLLTPGAGQVIKWETLKTNGLGSIDRNNKATLLFTPPCFTTKSYAKELFPRMIKLQDVSWCQGIPPRHGCRPARIQGQRPIRIQLRCAG